MTAGGCPVVRAFEDVVDAGPDRPAIVRPDRTVSFAELDGRANAIAHYLSGRPGTAADPVALSIVDPTTMIAAQLGTLKAGRPFVVVNPRFPASRREALLAVLHPPVVLTDELGPLTGTAERPANTSAPTDLAYVLFTSGSTGSPKGVAQDRRDMWHNVGRHAPLGIGPTDRVSLISADGVVSAISNLVIGLLNGAAVVPYSYRDDGVHTMVDWINGTGVTVFYAFPSFLRQSASVSTSTAAAVRLAYLGGEPVLPTDIESVARLFPQAVRATGLNSTETGLTRLYQLPAGAAVPARVPVGGPVVDVEVVVGADGGLTIRSPYVRPRLWTVDGPVELAAPGADGQWELPTGDRGELMADGNLVHLGRTDTMLKVRGFRVEPSEVEAGLAKVEGVGEVGVLGYLDPEGQTELAAVVTVTDPLLNPPEIRRRAADLLPAPMVPSTVLIRDRLPRTGNGKLDRLACAKLVTAAATVVVQPAVSPERGTYQRLHAIWQVVLRTGDFGGDDDFFSLGGTSISALSVISRVRKEFGVPVRLAVLFETPTLTALTAAVDEILAASPQHA